MAALFDDILLKGIRTGQAPGKTAQAREWYRTQAKAITRTQRNRSQGDKLIKELKSDKERRQDSRFMMGNMYLFAYDPKHKDTLPYYDRFPLIFPINKSEIVCKGFLK